MSCRRTTSGSVGWNTSDRRPLLGRHRQGQVATREGRVRLSVAKTLYLKHYLDMMVNMSNMGINDNFITIIKIKDI